MENEHSSSCPRNRPSRDDFSCNCPVMAWKRIEVKLNRVIHLPERDVQIVTQHIGSPFFDWGKDGK